MKCASCNDDAVVNVSWIISMGPQVADLCENHAKYVQDFILAKEAADINFCGALSFLPVG